MDLVVGDGLKGHLWILCCHGDKQLCTHVHTLNQSKVKWFGFGFITTDTHTVRDQSLLLQGEAEVASAVLDLVLGLQVVHAFCGDAINGQNHVSNSNAALSCLPTVCELQKHRKLK